MKKINVAILMGGPSAEHEVSLKSGEMVFKNLDSKKYLAKKIVINKNGKWQIPPLKIKQNFDIAFIAMHGEYGEDGKIQKILEKYKIPYTGSNSRASELGMDKIKSLKLFKEAGLNTPARTKKVPLVIKPADRGSSVGTSIVVNIKKLPSAIKLAKKYSKNILIEQFIKGREMTCGVLQKKNKLIALPPTEIIPLSRTFFDYKAKYTKGASSEITPPKNLSKGIIKEIQEATLKAHHAIGARGFSRSDFILDNNNKLYILEINTIPGMTETSLLPQEARAAEINFPKLLDIIIDTALLTNR